MLQLYTPYVSEQTTSFETEPPEPAAFAARFEAITARYPWLAAEENGEVVGYAYAAPAFERRAYRFVADLSVYLRADKRGLGYGKRLVQAIEAVLQGQGVRALYALVTSENRASCAFHEAMGYRRIGTLADCGYKFGRWLSVVWYEKRLGDLSAPKELLPWEDVWKTSDFSIGSIKP